MIICSPQLGLAPQSNSGGEVYDREILLRLAQKNLKVLILLPRGRSHPESVNPQVKHALIRSMAPPHIFSLFAMPSLVKTYLTYRFDVLRIHNPYFLGPAVLAFKKLFPQVPVLGSFLHLEDGVNFFIAKATISAYDHIIAISRSTKQELVDRLGFPVAKIDLAYPGVDSRFAPGPKPKRLIDQFNLQGKTVLMYLGGLKPRKNPGFLLRLIKRLNQPRLVLVFAGTGPELLELKPQAKRLGVEDKVRFTGFVPEDEKPDFYRLADVLFLPSFKEGFGMTVTEAAACAVPAVAADNSSIKELIIPGKTGFLAETGAVDPWVNSTLQLIKSEKLRRQMGQAARQHAVKTFTWKKNIDTHMAVINKLIKGGRNR